MGAGKILISWGYIMCAKVLDKVGKASPTSEKESLREREDPWHAASSQDTASKCFGAISANFVCVVG